MKKCLLLFSGLLVSVSLFGQTNLALNKPVTCNGQLSGYEAYKAVDGSTSTRWAAEGFPKWIRVDLGQPTSINRTEILPYYNRAYQYKIEVSSDDSVYTLVVDKTNNTAGGAVLTDGFAPTIARYVKLTVTGYPGTTWISLYEFRVFADNLFYSDGFDAGSFEAGWSNNGSLFTSAYTHNSSAYAVEMNSNDILTLQKDAAASKNLKLEYYVKTVNCGFGDYFFSEYFDGMTWQLLDAKNSTVDWTFVSLTLPEKLANNPDFRVRFCAQISSGGTAYLDDVKITSLWNLSYEAENGTPGASVSIVNDPACSKGQYANLPDKLGSLSLFVNVPNAGLYLVTTHYKSIINNDFHFIVNNQFRFDVNDCNSSSPDIIEKKGLLVPLKAGDNTITYYNNLSEDNSVFPAIVYNLKLDKIDLSAAETSFPYTANLEAENATLIGQIPFENNSKISSNRQRLGMFSGTGIGDKAVVFNTFLPRSGKYVVSIYYVCRNDRSLTYQVNSNPPVQLTGLNSGGQDTITKRDVFLELPAGNNTITLFSENYAIVPKIDRIIIAEILEAESGILAGGAAVGNNANCSGGAFVTNLGNSGTLQLQVNAPVNGFYTLTLYYLSADERSFFVSANSGTPVELPYCNSLDLNSTTGKEVDLYLQAGANTLQIGNASGNCPNLDMLVMRYKDEQDLQRTYGRHVMLNVERNYYNNISPAKLAAWTGNLDIAYERYLDLTGTAPFNGRLIEIKSFHDQGTASGNPIYYCSESVARDFTKVENNDDWLFGIIHEMGHDFDYGYIEYADTAHEDDECGWNFHGEFWANTKLCYVMYPGPGIWPQGVVYFEPNPWVSERIEGPAIKTMFESKVVDCYNNTISGLQRYHHDGLTYCFLRMQEAIGWTPFKLAFRDFVANNKAPQGRLAQFDQFFDTLRSYAYPHNAAEGSFLPGEFEFVRTAIATTMIDNNTLDEFDGTSPQLKPRGWDTAVDTGVSAVFSNAAGRNGNAAKIELTGGNGNARLKQSNIKLGANYIHFMRVWVKTENFDPSGTISISVKFNDANHTEYASTPINAATDWRQITVPFMTGSSPETLTGEVRLNVNGSTGTVLFDDLIIEPTDKIFTN